MDQNALTRRPPAPVVAIRTEQVLESYYDQLVAWGFLLTRGDEGKAHDLVHDFCLHFSITKPDLSGVTNLDGYLYMSLRHIYSSSLARSCREALQFVNLVEFDSIQFALAPHQMGDSLQLQNDLRRICCYSTWRKAQTKSASYFILRFFHGYHHQEIADLACAPISAIYNKLRLFRTEVRSWLEEPGKLQFTSRELSPKPTLHWTSLSSIDLFKELRKAILDARADDCLPEEELVALYRTEHPKPISCSLLSHIVSCERCLALVDGHLQRPTLKDREPLDEVGDCSDGAGAEVRKSARMSREHLLRSVRKYRTEILEHRPRTLSIAVDGKILASHDVQAQRSALSARVERPENVRFVEVFSEQGIRLALLSIGDLPPEGPHGQTQRVALSDDRWLDLSLSFDGLGLNCEVVYFDPAPVYEFVEEQEDSDAFVRVLPRLESSRLTRSNILPRPRVAVWLATIRRTLHPVASSPVIAWSVVIACVFCVAGYFVLRNPKAAPVLSASEVLNRSIQIETASHEGQTEHQVLHFEDASVDGRILKQGTVDLWKDGDGKRHMRRLYDMRHRLIAAEWKQRNGDLGQYQKPEDTQPPEEDRQLMADDLWKQDVSSSAFRDLGTKNVQVRSTEGGFELTTSEPEASHPQFISATLVLDSDYHAVREEMRLRSGNDIHEVHFVEEDYERRPASSVSDAIFDPADQGLLWKADRNPAPSRPVATEAQLTELHIAVLYQLNALSADTSEPIDVEQTVDGHVLVSGTVADDSRKQEILSRLNLLDNRQLLQVQLVSPGDVPLRSINVPQSVTSAISMYELGETKPPADAALRTYFQSQGLSGEPLDAAVAGFSREALRHAQRALQNASALSRLSSTFPAADLRGIGLSSKQQWTEMAAKHAAAVEAELRTLHEQLASLTPSVQQPRSANDVDASIENAQQFERAASQLLLRTQDLNRNIGRVFASSQSPDAPPIRIESLVAITDSAIPLQQAVEIAGFAAQLSAAGKTTLMNRQDSRTDK
jgi:DNA-directed RNA polymerase specialized sigma24 family protein